MNPDMLRREIGELLLRHETEPDHVRHVTSLALSLFDQAQAWHGLSDTDRILLEAAATLHDIGWSVTQPTGAGHHKASARIIREHGWSGADRAQVEIIAQVARYHRKAPPAPHHRRFTDLEEPDRCRVRRLAALLRIADGLDRRHLQIVKAIRLRVDCDAWIGDIQSGLDPEPERVAATRKSDLLTQESSRPVMLRWRGTV